MNKADKVHMGKVKQMPCAICGGSPVEVHHIREGQGMAQRAGNFLTIPLCQQCHRGEQGVHGDKTMLRVYKTNELDLLNETLSTLYGA